MEKDLDEEPVLIVDDRFQEKPHTDDWATARWLSWPSWHYDHSKGRNVKGVNFLTLMASGRVQGQRCTVPINVHLVAKTATKVDAKGKTHRVSPVT